MIATLLGRYPTVSETFVYREIEDLLRAGEQVEVLALQRTRAPQAGLLSGEVQVLPTAHQALLRDKPSPALAERWAELGGRPKDLRRAGWLARHLRRSGVSALHVHFLGDAAAIGAAACQMAGLPLALTVHARGIYAPTPLGLWALRQARLVVAISEHAARACRQAGAGAVEVLPLGVEEAPPAPRGGEGFTVLTVARPAAKKGYPTLREALLGLEPPWDWRVAGAAAEEIGGPHPRLEALGPVAATRVEKMYQEGAHAFALACQVAPDGDQDGVPVALMEAMARGVPVVSCPVGGVGELIEDGETGLLVPPEDALALREALRRLRADPALRARLGDAGRAHVRATRRPEQRAARLRTLLTGLH
ncbi:MAG: glycosyltransferase family 4 protein [Alphaproteobacteria bacterium]|nr:glycosyltransferase family 4 protein [Alphaproteobacteria bacterium]